MGNSVSAREAFDKMDTDKSGELDFEEIKAAVAAMGEDPDDDRIRRARDTRTGFFRAPRTASRFIHTTLASIFFCPDAAP